MTADHALDAICGGTEVL